MNTAHIQISALGISGLTSLGVTVAATLLSAAAPRALTAGSANSIAQDDPPPASFGSADKGDSRLRVSTDAIGRIDYSLSSRTVSLSWSWTTTGPRPKQHSVQTESVAYFPTEAIGLQEDRAAVAGVRRDRVVIERWTLATAILPAPRVDPTTGEYSYSELTAPIRARHEICNEPAALGPIYSMFYQPKPPVGFTDSLLVLFSGSKEVYRVDARADGTSTLTKVASPNAAPNLLVEPGLSNPFRIRWGADHPTYGYVYVLGPALGQTPTFDGLVLYDQERDGTLDGALHLDGAAWNSGGWGDARTYVTMY